MNRRLQLPPPSTQHSLTDFIGTDDCKDFKNINERLPPPDHNTRTEADSTNENELTVYVAHQREARSRGAYGAACLS